MEVVKNQERYREVIYSGGALNSATLTINDNEIPISRIKSIKINSPIIDTEKSFFYVGTFTAQKVTIQFKNADSIELNGKVKLTISTMVDGTKTDVNMGEFLIDTTPENYYKSATITCYDKSILFKKNIDISQFFDEEGKITAENLLKALCNYYLGENMLGTYPNVNRNATTALYDNTKSGKYYISDIAEIMGGNAKIGRDGKLYVIPLKQKPIVTINANKGKSWVLNSHYKISRVFYENLTRKYEFGEATDNSLNIRSTNVFVNDNETSGEEIIQNLYNELVGFEMYAIKHENYGDPTLDAWDIIDFQVNGVSYPSYNANTLTYEQNIMSTYETKIPSKQKEETTNVIKNENKQLYDISVTVNQVEGKINQTIQRVDDQEEKITSQEQSLNGLKTSVSTVEKDLATTNSNLEQTNKNVDGLSSKIDGVSADFKDFKDNEYVQSIENLQDQIDGAIQFWNGSAIPTINNYPANEWTTENDRNNHRADIYTVIEDVNGELKQGKSYRFDKVGDTWQWIELTDNELSAVQALAQQAMDKSNTNAENINKLSEKTSELEQTDSEIKASVSELNNQYEQDMTIDKKVEGYPIVVENAGAYNVEELKVYGNSEQDTRSGKNKINISKYLFANYHGLQNILNEDGSVTTTGKPTTDYSSIIKGYIINDELENGETYTFSQKNANSKLYCQMNIKDNDTGTFTYIGLNSNTINQKSFVVDKSKYTYYMNIQTGPMTSWGDENLTITNFYQLEKGSLATDFEKYGVMPSPEYPSEIRNVEPIKINICPDNFNEWESGHYSDTDGTKVDSQYRIRLKNLIEVKQDKYYFDTFNDKCNLIIRTYDKDGKFIKSVGGISNKGSYLMSENEKYIGVSMYMFSSSTQQDKTTYEQYKELFKNNEIKPFICLNSEQDKSYVPYGHWLKGRITGNNLYNYQNVHTKEDDTIVDNDGWVTINCDNTNGPSTIYKHYYTNILKDLKPNGRYNIITEFKSISGTGTIFITSSDKSSQFNQARIQELSNLNSGEIYQVFTTTRDTFDNVTLGLDTNVRFLTGQSGSVTFRISILEDTTITSDNFSYGPYKEKEFLYNMNKYDEEGNITGYYELSKVNDIKDDVDFVSGVLNKRFTKYEITGNETWRKGSYGYIGTTQFNIYLLPNMKSKGLVICSHFTNVEYKKNSVLIGSVLNFYPSTDTGIIDVESWTNWLQDQYNAGTPVTIYYELETPQQIQLEPINVELFEGYNRITLEDKYGIVEEAEMTYLTDSKLNGQYATKAELKLTADSITSEVNKKVSTDNFNSTISDLDSKITQTADNIRSEVSSNYSTKSETNQAKQDAISSSNTATDNKLKNYTNTTDMNDAIDSAKSDAISSANNNTNEKLKSYSTTTQMQSAIDQKANEITSSVSQTYSTKTEVEEAVSNIEIGGRNLIRETRNFKLDGLRINGWNNDGSWTFSTDSENFVVAHKQASGLTANSIKNLYSTRYPISSGDTLMFSCWVMVDDVNAWDVMGPFIIEGYDSSNARIQFQDVRITDNNTNKPKVESGKWFYITAKFTFTNPNVTQAGMRLALFRNGSINIKKCKVEFGNKATDWTPAPEDTDSQIDTAKNDAISSANTATDNKLKSYSTTTQMNNAITQKITESENSIQASVSGQIKDSEGNIAKDVDGKLELYIKKGKDGKDDLISGFNLNANEVEINSDNFKLDKEGNIEFNKGTARDIVINGGDINLQDNGGASARPTINISTPEGATNPEGKITISTYGITSNFKMPTSTISYQISPVGWYYRLTQSAHPDDPVVTIISPGSIVIAHGSEDYENIGFSAAADGAVAAQLTIKNAPTASNHAVRLQDIPKLGTDGYSYDIDGRNLETITDSGFYYGNDMTGGPYSPFYGFLLVISHASSKYYTTQVLFPQGNVSVVYLRQQNGAGAWSSWYKINAILA